MIINDIWYQHTIVIHDIKWRKNRIQIKRSSPLRIQRNPRTPPLSVVASLPQPNCRSLLSPSWAWRRVGRPWNHRISGLQLWKITIFHGKCHYKLWFTRGLQTLKSAPFRGISADQSKKKEQKRAKHVPSVAQPSKLRWSWSIRQPIYHSQPTQQTGKMVWVSGKMKDTLATYLGHFLYIIYIYAIYIYT
jgi:hypothetical protein